MTLSRDEYLDNEISFVCDTCGAELATDTAHFRDALRYMQSKHWVVTNEKGEWVHTCQACIPGDFQTSHIAQLLGCALIALFCFHGGRVYAYAQSESRAEIANPQCEWAMQAIGRIQKLHAQPGGNTTGLNRGHTAGRD